MSLDDAFREENPEIIDYLQRVIMSLAPYFADVQKVIEILRSFPQIKQQLNYSFKTFAGQLRVFGFGEAEATKVAADIVLKPLLFSFLPRGLLFDDPAELFTLQPGETSFEQVLARNHCSIMAEMGVYLFDQLTDDFNFKQALHQQVIKERNKIVDELPESVDERESLGLVIYTRVMTNVKGLNLPEELLSQLLENEICSVLKLKGRKYNHVEQMISVARQQLPTNPGYYLARLNYVTFSAQDNSYTFSAFDKLFAELFALLNQMQAEPELLAGFIADVITGEHLTIVLKELAPNASVKPYADFFVRNGLQTLSSKVSVEQALAEAILKNQGLTLVMYTALVFSGKGAAIKGLAEKLSESPELAKFIYQTMGFIRLLDDIGDMEIDKVHDVVNLLTASDNVKRHFMQLSFLGEDPYLSAVVFDGAKATTQELLKSYKQMADTVSGQVDDHNRDLVQAIQAVCFAAFINAQFNDIDALQATMQMVSK